MKSTDFICILSLITNYFKFQYDNTMYYINYKVPQYSQSPSIKKSTSIGLVEQKFKPIPQFNNSLISKRIIQLYPNSIKSSQSSPNTFFPQSLKSSIKTPLSIKSHKQYFEKSELRVIKTLKNKKQNRAEDQKTTNTNKSTYIQYESLYWDKIKKKKSMNLNKKIVFSCRVTQTRQSTDLCRCQNPCKWAKKWTSWAKTPNKSLYYDLQSLPIIPATLIQIQKDIPRTQPFCPAFKQQNVQQMLKQILVTYSKYDKIIQYVQGMNMIASVILYHIKNSQQSFWVLVDIMQQQQLLQIYENQKLYEQLQIHNNNILKLLKFKVNDLYMHLENLEIDIKPAMLGWYLSLLCNLIPLEFAHLVIDNFIKKGWNSLYKIIIAYFIYIKQELILEFDETEILKRLSVSYKSQYEIQWEQIIESIDNIIIESILTR